MGKLKRKNKSQPRGKVHTKKMDSVQDLIEKGNAALLRVEPDVAYDFFKKAYEISGNDTNIMDMLADVSLQIGEHDFALELLLKSTGSAPNENPHKWFYLAQLHNGMESIQYYQTGINLLNNNKDKATEPNVCVT